MQGTAGQATAGRLPEVMTFRQLAGVIAGLKEERGARRLVVGIDGMSGSGKTDFASRLATELAAPVLGTDDLVPSWDGLAASVGLLTDWVLRPLAAGRPARWRRYDWLAGRPGEWTDLDPGDCLVVEGCCTGLYPAATYLSYLVWIDVPEAERRRRLERRQDWPAYAPFADRWARQEAKLQATAGTAGRADLVVDNGTVTPAGLPDSFACFRKVRADNPVGNTGDSTRRQHPGENPGVKTAGSRIPP